jgi:hypothetical protein
MVDAGELHGSWLLLAQDIRLRHRLREPRPAQSSRAPEASRVGSSSWVFAINAAHFRPFPQPPAPRDEHGFVPKFEVAQTANHAQEAAEE